MATLTIRNLDDALKTSIRVEAAKRGRSMEEEARQLLREGLKSRSVVAKQPVTNLAEAIRARFEPFGGVELDLLPREPMRDPPDFRGPDVDR